jgi:hypothetical protein
MEFEAAKQFIDRERSRHWLPGTRGSDIDLMWSRERLYNGLTIAFALVMLVSVIMAGRWNFILAIAAVLIARQCNKAANKCREAREALEAHNTVKKV